MTANSGYDFRALFTEEVRLAEGVMDLPRAALYLAGEEYPDLEPDHYLRRMDDMADEVRSLAGGSVGLATLARTFNRYLFDVKGFSGNTGDYYDPANSFLNRVMDTGIGIPITLSVLYLGVAARLALNCRGIGMPGHFLVKIEELDLYMDPFHGGQLLSAADCRRLAKQLFGSNLEWDERYLASTPPISILARMLNNLRIIYSQRRDLGRLAAVLERMMLIDPSNPALYRDLAICYVEQGDNAAAVRLLEGLINLSTSERDVAAARNLINSILSSG
jgi:regulator of sirC expression with transglutaminase-like and TPR domain